MTGARRAAADGEAAVPTGRARLAHLVADHEDWALVLLGALTVLLVIGLGVLTAWSIDRRDAGLADARATVDRLVLRGHDEALSNCLINLQQDEVGLFESRLDMPPVSGKPASCSASNTSGDPRADLAQADSELAAVAADHPGSAEVQRYVGLISRELPVYQGLQNTAQADNQQGLPVGPAYLRLASGYLSDHMLGSADDIVRFDTRRLMADDRAAGGFPFWQPAVCVVGLAWLVAVQILLARTSRRTFNPGMLVATAAVLAMALWSGIAVGLSRHDLRQDAGPHALVASGLSQLALDATRANVDDQLTLVDDGEDCGLDKPGSRKISCTFEKLALALLPPAPGAKDSPTGLYKDLDAATEHLRPSDAEVFKATVTADVTAWRKRELDLPTPQNLVGEITRYGRTPREDAQHFGEFFVGPSPVRIADEPWEKAYRKLDLDVGNRTAGEWKAYQAAARGASGALNALVAGEVLLGVLAGALAAGGIGWRVAEYWTTGRRQS